MENHFLSNADMEPAGRYPYSLGYFKRSIENQNLSRPLIYGVEHYPEREAALDFPTARNEETLNSHPSSFWHPFGGRMAIDYTQKVMEGVRCLTQLGRRIDG